MATVVLSISGILAYADGSKGPFEATIDERGVLAEPFQSTSRESFASLGRDDATALSDLFDTLSNTLTVTTDDSLAKSGTTMSDSVFVIRGTVARDNGTSQSFVVEHNSGVIDHFPSETDDVWADVASSFSDIATELLEAVAGSGNVTI